MSTTPINVLFITDSLTIGGAEKQTVSLINNLVSSDLRLSLAYLKDNRALYPQLKESSLRNGVFCCDVQKKIDYAAIAKLAQHIESSNVDVIVCTNTYPLFYAWLARISSARKPKIVDVLHSTVLRTAKEKLQMLFYRPFFILADALVYVCDNQRTYWSKRFLAAKRDLVIHNGIDVDHFQGQWSPAEKLDFRQRFGFQEKDYVVGLCAAMRPEKAHGDLLLAAFKLIDEGHDIKCLLIGDGPERGAIEQIVRDHNKTDHVKITGYLDDVRLAISSCDVMALVSHQIETFSIAALEAMALEKPIVMSDIGGASEQVTPGVNGYLFEAGDLEALAGHLRKLGDARLRLEMGKRARELVVDNFSIDQMTKGYERLIQELVASK